MQSSNQGYMTFSTGIQYGQEEDIWETENNLKYAKGKLKKYKLLGYAAVKSIEKDTINLKIKLLC